MTGEHQPRDPHALGMQIQAMTTAHALLLEFLVKEMIRLFPTEKEATR